MNSDWVAHRLPLDRLLPVLRLILLIQLLLADPMAIKRPCPNRPPSSPLRPRLVKLRVKRRVKPLVRQRGELPAKLLPPVKLPPPLRRRLQQQQLPSIAILTMKKNPLCVEHEMMGPFLPAIHQNLCQFILI
jgi:hypothetical protein